MTDLRDKTALITGSARGIGRAVALRRAALGAQVVVNHAHDEDAAVQTVGEVRALGAEALAVQADVADPAALDLFQRTVIEGAGVFTDLAADHPMRSLVAAVRPLEGRFGTVDDVADADEYVAGPWRTGSAASTC
jgi:NAD(P)-dependent dehydrogenase (short-subunit alcohol dehydrogenase family)